MTVQLAAGQSVTLATVNGVVTGTASVGPTDQRGVNTWTIDTVIWKTNRPGVAPIPRIELFIDDASNPANFQMVDYDGSYGTAAGRCVLAHQQKLFAVWTGGTAGDIAQFTVTGEKS